MASNSGQHKFKWGVVGTGTIARAFINDMKYLDGTVKVAAIYGRSSEKVKNTAQEFGIPNHYDSFNDFLADPNIDGIYIALPNHLHFSFAEMALQALKPVLVEKPLCLNSDEAMSLQKLAREKNTFIMEAMWTRFLPAFEAVKKAVLSGQIGKIEAIEADLAYLKEEEQEGRFFDAAQGGGASLDLGVYPLSLTISLLGHPEAVNGNWSAAQTGVDKTAHYRLSYPDAKADISCGFNRNGRNEYIIYGSEGAILIHDPFLKASRISYLSHWAAKFWLSSFLRKNAVLYKLISRMSLPGKKTINYPLAGNGLHYQAAAMVAAIAAGKTEIAQNTLEDSVQVLQIIDQVLTQPPIAS